MLSQDFTCAPAPYEDTVRPALELQVAARPVHVGRADHGVVVLGLAPVAAAGEPSLSEVAARLAEGSDDGPDEEAESFGFAWTLRAP